MAESTSTLPIYDIPTTPVARRRRWPAALTLLLLAPVIPEMLTGSTPPLQFINPFSLILEVTLYGCGAILVRELVRRRGFGWRNVLLLGMAYGILEEGLVLTSWFNPYWGDLGKLSTYGRLFETSWVWATELTLFHSVVSITIPIMLAEVLFPKIASRPWLGKRGLRVTTVLLVLTSLFQFVLFALLAFRKYGYSHPPLMWVGVLALAVGLVWFGLRYRPSLTVQSQATMRLAPGLWKTRLLAFGATFAFFFIAWILPSLIPLAIVPMLLMPGLAWLIYRLLVRWSSRPGWSRQHLLALTSGVIAFFAFVESPLAEFATHPTGKNEAGLVLVDLLFLAGLGVLSWVVARKDR